MAGDSKSKTVEVKGRTLAPTKPIEEQREKIAGILSIVTIVIFGVTILAPLVALILAGGNISKINGLLEFIKVILPAEAALLGVSFGFYFSQTRLKSKD